MDKRAISPELARWAWEELRRHPRAYIGGTAISFLPFLASVAWSCHAWVHRDFGSSDWILHSAVTLAAFLVSASFYLCGCTRIALGTCEGLRAFLINPLQTLGPCLALNAITLLGLLLCLPFFAAPGLILAALWFLALPAVVDQRVSPIRALAWSWRIVRPQLIPALGACSVTHVAAIAGAFVCGVAFCVTFPLYPIGQALLFAKLPDSLKRI